MWTKSTTLFSLALLAGMTSTAFAATHHPTHRSQTAVERQAAGANAYASACTAKDPMAEPTYMWLQDRAGGSSWPLRPNGWQAGAPCNPRGTYH